MNRFDRFYNLGYADASDNKDYACRRPTGFSPEDWRAYKTGVSQALYDQRGAAH